MKFTINREYFLKALLSNSRIITTKEESPILANLKFEINNERLEIVSSNGEINIKTTIERFQNDKEIIRDIEVGSILINAKMITEIVKRLESREISFSIEDGVLARIVNDRAQFNINVLKAEEYSDIDFEEEGIYISLKRNDLINAVNQVGFAANTKENRKVLSSVHIEGENDILSFTATDGARLANKEISYPNVQDFKVNIPARNIVEALRNVTDEERIEMFITTNRVLFKFKDSIVTVSTALGDYPNTKNIIPKNYYYTLEVNGNEFLKVCERIALVSIDRVNIVKCTMNANEVVVSSRSQAMGNSSESLQLFKFEGERLEISFNVEFVAQAIRALKTEDIEIRFLGEMKPFMIISKADKSTIQLITPVRTY